ncbi:hypothetical protein BD560DRAFT_484270 [Blakeslea trispora]|nr:hypothetical protein BD560DRAFT_484270 [Blakeslea trispora]
MLLLILFYVYKWMTVPWSYYDSAKSRHMLYQHSPMKKDCLMSEREKEKNQAIQKELHRHELVGLAWVILSPLIAGYTLHSSRYFLSNFDHYISSFNIGIFILAASIKPVTHVMTLLQERTLFLQSESQIAESQIDLLENKIDILEKQVYWLRRQASKKHGDHNNNHTLHHLTKAFNRAEKRDIALRSCMQEQLDEMDSKVREFSQKIGIQLEPQQQHKFKKNKKALYEYFAWHTVVHLFLLPLHVSLWIVRHTLWFLPTNSSEAMQEKDELSSFVPYNSAESCYSSEGNIAAF